MSTNKRILITGGAGFIGSRLVTSLCKYYGKEVKIWVFDNLHPQVHGENAVYPVSSGNVVFVNGNMTDTKAVNQVVDESRPIVVYHLAAETGTGQSFGKITRYCDVNVTGTAHLVEAIRKFSSQETKQLILASSRAIYGEGAYRDQNGNYFVGMMRDPEKMSKGVFSVSAPERAALPIEPAKSCVGLEPAPASIYASTKIMQEYIVTQVGEGEPWNATIFRFQNVYGPGQSLSNPYTGVLSIFCEQTLNKGKLSIYEDGNITRDFVFVDDVVNALLLSAHKELPHGAVIDIGLGVAVTIKSVAEKLVQALGRKDQTKITVTGEFRIGDIRYACADISLAKKLLGWMPTVGIDEGLQLLADWAKSELVK